MKSILACLLLISCIPVERNASIRRAGASLLVSCLNTSPETLKGKRLCYNTVERFCIENDLEKGCGFDDTNQWFPKQR
jgi:hypothetical protein